MPIRSNSSSYERTVEHYNKMSMSDLKEVAKLKNLSQKGSKSDLVARLSKSEEPVVVLEKLDSVRGRTKKASQNGNANGLHSSLSKSSKQEQQQRQLQLLTERESLVLWLHPFRTIGFFILELGFQCRQLLYRLAENSVSVACVVALAGLAVLSVYVPGPHLQVLASSSKYFWWCAYWVGLGILSSVGLGTGLHTFLLYLGPHIAAVTLAAFECKTVDFPEPPYPDEIVCPDSVGAGVTLWTIISKVRLEAFMWGAGTALGELPPYFMARAARLSGQLDEEEEELMELIDASKKGKQQGVLDRAKLAVHGLVKRVGFVGILLCASIPNPLFDLAGITCGHFLVPFWTFFGATLIGKALIKMHIQMLFVIFTFSASHVDHVVQLIGHIPHYGPQLQAPFREYLEKQKTKLHHKPGTGEAGSDSSMLAWIFEKVVALFLLYFIVSIVNSMAQNYHKRISRVQQQQIKAASRR